MVTEPHDRDLSAALRAGRSAHRDGGPPRPIPTIIISPDAREYVALRGGTIYLRVRQTRCCSGAITFLDASTTARHDEGNYVALDSEFLAVRLLDIGVGLPDEVSVELRGKIRPRLTAYWNGCACRL
jgi:hypothetical protein